MCVQALLINVRFVLNTIRNQDDYHLVPSTRNRGFSQAPKPLCGHST